MKHPVEHLDYDDFQALIREARMQRSMAVGDAIAGLVAALQSVLMRAVNVGKSRLSAAKSHARADADSALDVPVHR